LNLLYIDGMAAAKSNKGTLDSQDYILLREKNSRHEVTWDTERAQRICKLAKEEWAGRIDGVIRMEAGFEIILCSFEDNMDVVRITRAKEANSTKPGPIPGFKWDYDDAFAYVRAIAARYQGIGGGRVVLNYEAFVTAYAYPLNLFNSHSLPRLQNVSSNALAALRYDVDKLVMGWTHPIRSLQNWQEVADMIVERYASQLKYLVSGKLSNSTLLREHISRMLSPFIDYDARNVSLESQRCATQFFPSAYNDCMASRAILKIAHLICSTLSSAAAESDYDGATHSIKHLIEYLNWPKWKECRGCDDDEVCFPPLWPAGTIQDYNNPSCINATGLASRYGYWTS